MKKTSTFQNGLIWFGAGVSIAEILTGTYFAPLGFLKGLLAIIIGHVIGCSMLFFAGLIGGRSKRSAMGTVGLSFGKIGGLFFAVLNILQLVGWTAIMIYDGALAANGVVDSGAWVWCVVIGGLILVWIAVGVENLGWINKIAMAALFILTIVLCFVIFQSQFPSAESTETITFGAACCSNAYFMVSTDFRLYARSRKALFGNFGEYAYLCFCKLLDVYYRNGGSNFYR